MTSPSTDAARFLVVGLTGRDLVALVSLDGRGRETGRRSVARDDVADVLGGAGSGETTAPRIVWGDTARWYRDILARGRRVERCHDLRLCHAILAAAAHRPGGVPFAPAAAWSVASHVPLEGAPDALFEIDDAPGSVPQGIDDALAEFARQLDALSMPGAGGLRRLVAAVSVGALIGAEMTAAGLPWDAVAHDGILRTVLGPRPPAGGVPSLQAALGARVRELLGDPAVSLDSQPKLLRALHRAGVPVQSTGRWELREHRHPAIEPLIEYKKLARLASANGWAWLDEWVHDGRFRPAYVPGGVVTGRWASSGGGALQIPRLLRPAVRADEGWLLVCADVAQLEPRVLAAMAGDRAMADAARGADLYAGIVERGAVTTRDEAKVAMLGAMYGATSGESGRLVPRLRRVFPHAMALVNAAAATGERGGVVTTWWGRTSPPPSHEWRALQSHAHSADAGPAEEAIARRAARDRGRFARNFVVQGTAAEWALVWLADLRARLRLLTAAPGTPSASASGPAFAHVPHLVFWLHDEVIVHTPEALAEPVAGAVREAAASAGRLLFGDFPIDFPLDLRVSRTAGKG
ncbi:bifunctional 3'-5' exonuclease/DNA polymerase [Microbacterium sp. NPDC078428]|uniref:bifunctional 3'-5' exonuclease/DNA polymerase n=1 Tax=Microbacterium sp. NPDC078428 TaxID=3364190 RepID=UPI0037C8FC60